MKITILVEGKTETAFKGFLREFLKTRLAGKMPNMDFRKYDGRIPTGTRLKQVVENLLNDRKKPADAVIALTDVYTGSNPPEFQTAEDAKRKMRQWVGVEEKRFHPHVALHDFEAWLLPYWEKIQKLAGTNRKAPSAEPERVNHGNPPAHRLVALFRIGVKKQSYVKARDVGRILNGEKLETAINACPELKAFVNTIIRLCDASKVIA